VWRDDEMSKRNKGRNRGQFDDDYDALRTYDLDDYEKRDKKKNKRRSRNSRNNDYDYGYDEYDDYDNYSDYDDYDDYDDLEDCEDEESADGSGHGNSSQSSFKENKPSPLNGMRPAKATSNAAQSSGQSGGSFGNSSDASPVFRPVSASSNFQVSRPQQSGFQPKKPISSGANERADGYGNRKLDERDARRDRNAREKGEKTVTSEDSDNFSNEELSEEEQLRRLRIEEIEKRIAKIDVEISTNRELIEADGVTQSDLDDFNVAIELLQEEKKELNKELRKLKGSLFGVLLSFPSSLSLFCKGAFKKIVSPINAILRRGGEDGEEIEETAKQAEKRAMREERRRERDDRREAKKLRREEKKQSRLAEREHKRAYAKNAADNSDDSDAQEMHKRDWMFLANRTVGVAIIVTVLLVGGYVSYMFLRPGRLPEKGDEVAAVTDQADDETEKDESGWLSNLKSKFAGSKKKADKPKGGDDEEETDSLLADVQGKALSSLQEGTDSVSNKLDSFDATLRRETDALRNDLDEVRSAVARNMDEYGGVLSDTADAVSENLDDARTSFNQTASDLADAGNALLDDADASLQAIGSEISDGVSNAVGAAKRTGNELGSSLNNAIANYSADTPDSSLDEDDPASPTPATNLSSYMNDPWDEEEDSEIVDVDPEEASFHFGDATVRNSATDELDDTGNDLISGSSVASADEDQLTDTFDSEPTSGADWDLANSEDVDLDPMSDDDDSALSASLLDDSSSDVASFEPPAGSSGPSLANSSPLLVNSSPSLANSSPLLVNSSPSLANADLDSSEASLFGNVETEDDPVAQSSTEEFLASLDNNDSETSVPSTLASMQTDASPSLMSVSNFDDDSETSVPSTLASRQTEGSPSLMSASNFDDASDTSAPNTLAAMQTEGSPSLMSVSNFDDDSETSVPSTLASSQTEGAPSLMSASNFDDASDTSVPSTLASSQTNASPSLLNPRTDASADDDMDLYIGGMSSATLDLDDNSDLNALSGAVSPLSDDFDSWESPPSLSERSPSSARNASTAYQSPLSNSLENMNSRVEDFSNQVDEASGNFATGLQNRVDSFNQSVNDGVDSFNQSLNDGVSSLQNLAQQATDTVNDSVSGISNSLEGAGRSIRESYDNLTNSVSNAYQSTADSLQSVGDNISSNFQSLQDTFSSPRRPNDLTASNQRASSTSVPNSLTGTPNNSLASRNAASLTTPAPSTTNSAEITPGTGLNSVGNANNVRSNSTRQSSTPQSAQTLPTTSPSGSQLSNVGPLRSSGSSGTPDARTSQGATTNLAPTTNSAANSAVGATSSSDAIDLLPSGVDYSYSMSPLGRMDSRNRIDSSMIATPSTRAGSSGNAGAYGNASIGGSAARSVTPSARQGAVASGYRQYVTKEGDNLLTIAENELGSSSRWGEIKRLNNLRSGAAYFDAGTTLLLPATTTPSADK